MNNFKEIYNKLCSAKRIRNKLISGIFVQKGKRKYSVAIAGGALGDEGKGRVTDELTSIFLERKEKVVHYRDNGGSNAGHTVQVKGKTFALHQLGSGVLQKGCFVVMGKGMVIHPEDLVRELDEVKKLVGGRIPATVVIDEMAALCLDTHRGFEAALKMRERGGRGSTGRGIASAYADIIYRHPIRFRDLVSSDWKKKLTKHYKLYADLVKGLGQDIKTIEVPRLSKTNVTVGSLGTFLRRIADSTEELKPYIKPAYDLIMDHWNNGSPFVFEKAQALGLDIRWGVYPDVTASDCSFDGIYSSTEGVVDPDVIPVRAITIKATYSSSVGMRQLPTAAEGKLAHRIREDANEYGASTGRPRDIVNIDLPMLSYLAKVSKATHLVITHLDVCYLDQPVKVCVGYKKGKKAVDYRPDQEYLLGIKPEYIEVDPWDGKKLGQVQNIQDLPKNARIYCEFLSRALNLDLLMVTVGPGRDQTLRWFKS